MKPAQTTKHTHPMIFGRREAGCPRCEELNAGAEPVRWNIQSREARNAEFSRSLDAHKLRCESCKTGVGVCTFGDW